MKIKVTQRGIRDQDGKRVPIGTVLDIKGDTIPAGMVNKVEVIADKGRKTLTVDNEPAPDEAEAMPSPGKK